MEQYYIQKKWVDKTAMELPLYLFLLMLIPLAVMLLGYWLSGTSLTISQDFIISYSVIIISLEILVSVTNYYKAKIRVKNFTYEFSKEGINFEQPIFNLHPGSRSGKNVVSIIFDALSELKILGVEKHSFAYDRIGDVVVFEGWLDVFLGLASIILVFKDNSNGVNYKSTRFRKGQMFIDVLGYKDKAIFIPGLSTGDAQKLKMQLDNYVTQSLQ